jgi:hypothetical protein
LLVVDSGETGLTLATVDKVLETGEVTPIMKIWLERYSKESGVSGGNRFLLRLLPILDSQLREDILNSKFK